MMALEEIYHEKEWFFFKNLSYYGFYRVTKEAWGQKKDFFIKNY